MALLKGISVKLYEKEQTGTDKFKAPIYKETPVEVENVLVCPAGSEAIVSDLQLYGKQAVYELCIPKGNTNVWEDRVVEFFGQKWKTFGFAQELIEDNVPLEWNKRIKVARNG